MTEKKVLAVIVTYNRIEKLKECITHLKNQTVKCDVLIVDNASTDGTSNWICHQQDLRYEQLKENTGGAGGFYHGIKKAITVNYDYVWLMDDDCYPNKNALEELLKADEILKGNYGWLSSVVLWKDGHECKMNRPKLKKSFYEYSEYLKDGLILAEQATFVSLFVKSDTVKKVGYPIKEYFIWGDDIEYTRRIAVRYSIPSFVVGKSQVVHNMDSNNGSSISTDDMTRINRYKLAFRNDGFTYRQEGFKGFCYYIGKCGINIIRIFARKNDKKLKRLGILLSGMFTGFVFNPHIEQEGNNNEGN